MISADNRHKIKSILFDIIFDDERRAQELYDQVRHIHYNSLESEISACLDEFAPANKLTELKRVELDLGEIEYPHLEMDLVERTKKALREKLKQLLFSYESDEPGDKQKSFSNFETLAFYFTKGYLPWNAEGNIGKLLDDILSEDPALVAVLLKKLGNQALVRERLAFRFGGALHKRIVLAIEPTEGNRILMIHNELVKHFLSDQLLGKTKGELDSAVWLFIYNYLLTNPGATFNFTEFIKNILVQFSNHFNLSFTAVIVSLTETLNKSDDTQYDTLLESLDEISKNFKIDIKKTEFGFRNFERLSLSQKIEILIEYLNTGTIDPPVVGISQAHLDETFLMALQQVPDEIIGTLKGLNDSSVSVAEIISNFDLKVIYRVIQVVAPGHHYSIINFEKGFIAIHRKEQLVQASEKELSETVLGFILKALLYSKGTYFNQKVFLKNLIEKTAAHYNITYHQFFEKLYETASTISSKSVRFHIFFQLISELKEEDFLLSNKSVTDAPDQGQGSEEKNEEKLFWSVLNSGVYVENGSTVSALQALRNFWKKHPANAKSILSKFLARKENRKKMAGMLSRAALLELVQLYHRRNVLDFDHLYNRFTEAGRHLKKYIPSAKAYDVILKQLIIWQTVEISEGWNFEAEKITEAIAAQLALIYKIDAGIIIAALPPAKVPKADMRAINDLQPYDSIVPAIIHRLIYKPSDIDLKNLQKWGFNNYSELIRHMVYYKRKMVIKALKKGNKNILDAFVKKLKPAPLEMILTGINSTNAVSTQRFLKLIKYRLTDIGFYKTSDLMKELSGASLVFLLKNDSGNFELLINSLEEVLNKYELPDAFFSIKNQIAKSAYNQIEGDIDRLERSLLREINIEQRKISKTKIVLEEILEGIAKSDTGIAYNFGKKEPEITEEFFLQNAGIVILQAYLPYFFEQCGLFQDGKFSSVENAKRGAMLLQYIFDEQTTIEEEQLIINKLLCGLRFDEILPNEIQPTEHEKEIISQMFDAIISHWELIKNSTHSGFRESWIRRTGKLVKKEASWELTVEQRAFDILLDHIPFSLSPVKFSWMKEPIIVLWR
ncbi:MAG: contractile injection system tape measure protein [Bacteroidota bacterium]